MQAIKFENDILFLLDQTLLPIEEVWREYTDYKEAGKAIKTMVVRGAPAIGITAAYAMVLAAKENRSKPLEEFNAKMIDAKSYLAGTRPTAVNLFWALDRMEKIQSSKEPQEIYLDLLNEAHKIHEEDIKINRKMGEIGAEIVPQGARILTHCNAGALATGGYGTALGVIRAAHAAGKVKMVYVDETRPLLQGARLTAYELMHEVIPATLISDNMAGWLMKNKMIDMIILGGDRVCSNGDIANKIGTYSLSVLAKYHNIPFYSAVPYSTIDLSLKSGDEIPIEQRNASEVTEVFGKQIAPPDILVFNPAFDVAPNELITGIITERGIARAPYTESLKKMFAK